ncbi:MAG: putative metalloprotease CJM1_0395 family protein [Candidatus Thiodiazotropha sp.]
MNLSISSASAPGSALSPLDRRAGPVDPEHPATSTPEATGRESDTTAAESSSQRPARETGESSRLTPEEQSQINDLQQRDREVKAHELAHKAVGGRYVTGGSFTYQTGPDGRRYAIGGEVTINNSRGSTPEETLRKAELIRRAALAPADPSPQDYRVASQANLVAAQARGEIAAEQREAALERQEAMQERQKEQAAEETGEEISQQNRRAIATFEAVDGITRLQSNPDPIDELI